MGMTRPLGQKLEGMNCHASLEELREEKVAPRARHAKSTRSTSHKFKNNITMIHCVSLMLVDRGRRLEKKARLARPARSQRRRGHVRSPPLSS